MDKKISNAEAEQIAEKIRKKYNDLIVTYMLAPRLRDGFEARYNEIKRYGVDQARFLNDEIQSLKAIELKEKEKINKAAKSKNIESEKLKETDKKDFADKVMEDLFKKIEKYPTLFIHSSANKELEKLFGALIDFDKNMWKTYEDIAKKYRFNKYDIAFVKLEKMLNDFTRVYSENVTVRLLPYKDMLNSPFSKISNIDREEKLCILECAVLIKMLMDTVTALINYSSILQNEKEKLLKLIDCLNIMTEDFRLKDLMTLGNKK
ncbi:MAG: hypothetical protein FWC36_02530 [Spirochaetes bacterium]|nr:hypothetical protein [Spirochaetota bacterium]